jgi:hypothetical protein
MQLSTWPQQVQNPQCFKQHFRGQLAVPLPHHEAQPVPQPQQGSQQLLQPQAGSQQLSPQPQPQAGSQQLPQPQSLQPTHGQIGAWLWQLQWYICPAYCRPFAQQLVPQPQHGSQQLLQPQAGSQQLLQPHAGSQQLSQPQPHSPCDAQPQLWWQQQSKPSSSQMPACEGVGANVIAATTASAVNRFRIAQFLSAKRARATGGCDSRGPRQVPPGSARVTSSALILGRVVLISSSARLPQNEKNRYNRPRLPAITALATTPAPAIQAAYFCSTIPPTNRPR